MGEARIRIFQAVVAYAMLVAASSAQAQQTEEFRVSTVTRPPFSMVVDGVDTGFSVDLLNAVADQLGRTVTYDRKDSFADILGAV